MHRAKRLHTVSVKLIACALVLAFVAIGAIGVVLPIIPGLLFLAIAAFIAARHFPSIDARLRKHRAIARRMHWADRFTALDFTAKVRVAGWLCAKMVIDAVALIVSVARRLIGSGTRAAPRR